MHGGQHFSDKKCNCHKKPFAFGTASSNEKALWEHMKLFRQNSVVVVFGPHCNVRAAFLEHRERERERERERKKERERKRNIPVTLGIITE